MGRRRARKSSADGVRTSLIKLLLFSLSLSRARLLQNLRRLWHGAKQLLVPNCPLAGLNGLRGPPYWRERNGLRASRELFLRGALRLFLLFAVHQEQGLRNEG